MSKVQTVFIHLPLPLSLSCYIKKQMSNLKLFGSIFVLLYLKVPNSSSTRPNFFKQETSGFEFDSKTPEEIVKFVEKSQSHFKATGQYFENSTIARLQKMLGFNPMFTYEDKPKSDQKIKLMETLPQNFERNFDPFKNWPECITVLDKVPGAMPMGCNLGWALSFAKALSDKLCIATNGITLLEISVIDLIQCCTNCFKRRSKEDLEGDAFAAWKHWLTNSIVSGGFCEESADQGCVAITSQFLQPDRPKFFNKIINHCGIGCHNISNNVEKPPKKALERYKNEKKNLAIGEQTYIIPSRSEDMIKAEIVTNGPVQAGIDVYEDFFAYKSGVYKYTVGKLVGFHSLVIMGWGEENGIKYWLATNVWGRRFGENGRMKILRGENECNIESHVIGATIKKQEERRLGPEETYQKSAHRAISDRVFTHKSAIVLVVVPYICHLVFNLQ